MTQLNLWRTQAFNRIGVLVGEMQPDFSPIDNLIDDLIRAINNLPMRPEDKPPYLGIFSVADALLGRQNALKLLLELRLKLDEDVTDVDGLVDDLIRVMSNLPPRPPEGQPYASLFPVAQQLHLTAEQILAIAPEADPDRVATLAPHLSATMEEFEINTPLRQAHFIAQLAHESDRFNALEEYASGKDYEGREDLGNVEPGDGVRFKGRGLIQITGRANYEKCGDALGVDLVSNPTLLSEPDLACRSAGWFWNTRKLSPDADNDDVNTVTYYINGGYNGLDDRIKMLNAAKQVLGI
jgi:putative chitinase